MKRISKTILILAICAWTGNGTSLLNHPIHIESLAPNWKCNNIALVLTDRCLENM